MIPGIPRSPMRAVLDAFVAALKADPRLANGRIIKNWLVYDGGPMPAEVTADKCPAAMVRLLGGPVRRLAAARRPGGPMNYINECKPSIVITVYAAGNDQGDVADLGSLIDSALAPADAPARAALESRFKDAGIKDWQQTRQILPGSAEAFADGGIVGQGSYELTVFLQS